MQVRVKLTLEEIGTGIEKKIRVKHQTRCATCDGRGGSGEETCTQCSGAGQVRRVQQTFFGQFVNVAPCPRCHGEGRTVRDKCPTCGGDGRLASTETIAVKVPAGVAEGNFIPLRGMGDAGPRGGPAGDLIVWIEEKEHQVFDRHGDDLVVDVPVGYPTLALGGRIDVPMLAGEAASLDVPSGTATGTVLRMRQRGLPSLRGGKGDLLARLIVWVPNKVSAVDRKQLEELSKSPGLRPPPPGKTLFERVKDRFAG